MGILKPPGGLLVGWSVCVEKFMEQTASTVCDRLQLNIVCLVMDLLQV